MDTAIRQIAADELNCDPDRLRICAARTDRTPDEGYTAGNLSISTDGAAVRWAASAFRQLSLAAASERLGCDAAELSLQGGRVLRNGDITDLGKADLALRPDLSAAVADWARPLAPADRSPRQGSWT